VRSGGFAGLTRETAGVIDEDEFAALCAARAAPSSGAAPDRFVYELEVAWGDERFSLVLGERDLPPELRPLVARLEASAGP
jgi:hypothetical protein